MGSENPIPKAVAPGSDRRAATILALILNALILNEGRQWSLDGPVYWAAGPFAFTLAQTVTDLPDGTYTLSAWIQGGGGEKTLQLSVSDYGGDPVTVDIADTGWQVWKTPTIAKFHVTNGKCTIGLKVASAGGSWAFLDDVSLVKVE